MTCSSLILRTARFRLQDCTYSIDSENSAPTEGNRHKTRASVDCEPSLPCCPHGCVCGCVLILSFPHPQIGLSDLRCGMLRAWAAWTTHAPARGPLQSSQKVIIAAPKAHSQPRHCRARPSTLPGPIRSCAGAPHARGHFYSQLAAPGAPSCSQRPTFWPLSSAPKFRK